MTAITITTIGYFEVIDLAHSPGGRVLTIIIAFSGIAVLSYFFSSLTAALVEGKFKRKFILNKMEKKTSKLNQHYIICGLGRIGRNVAESLEKNKKDFVIINRIEPDDFDELSQLKHFHFILGDASDDIVLEKAGITRAKGIFACTDSDNHNLVITLTARMTNPSLRIVTRCGDSSQVGKMKRAGANSTISPTHIGGMRMTAEMLSPEIAKFVDHLFLEQTDDNHLGSIPVGKSFAGKDIGSIQLRNFPSTILLAINRFEAKPSILFNPSRSTILLKGDQLIFITTHEEEEALKALVR